MLEIFIAFYATGVAIAMWRLWRPSYYIVKKLQPNNIMVQKPILSGIVVMVMFALMFPLLAYTILFDDKMERFINGFVKGVIGLNDR